MSGHVGALKCSYLQAPGARRRSRGAMLLLTMFMIALVGILLTVAGPVWHTAMQREREADLLWMGSEYARAITAYHAAPAQAREYPQQLGQLLHDVRQPNTVRHLRRLYRDPITGSTEWGLIKDAGGHITGVYSLGKGTPLKQGGFDKKNARFNEAKSFADWTFLAEPAYAASPLGTAAAGMQAPGSSAPFPSLR